MMKRIAIYIDWPDRLAFFARLAAGLRELGVRPLYFTNKWALHLRARRIGLDSRLLRRPREEREVDLGSTRELTAGVLRIDQARRLYWAATEALQELDAAEPLSGLLIWNGGDVVGAAARHFTRARGRPTLFLEIANLPGKLFADPEGVNAASSIARDPRLLDRWPGNEAEFERWLAAYRKAKSGGHVVPQARILDQVPAVGSLLNHVGFHLLRVPTDDHRSLLSKARTRWLSSHLRYPYDLRETGAGEYLFFPMQVSVDTQILLNSDVDNFAAIRSAHQTARERGLDLVVKPHPAEPERDFVGRLVELKRELGFDLVGGDTIAWIRGAREVVTINSTAGLEAMLLGKKVRFLGRTFYHDLAAPGRMASYVTSYLLDLDYFGDRQLTAAEAGSLLERLPAA